MRVAITFRIMYNEKCAGFYSESAFVTNRPDTPAEVVATKSAPGC